ncbi:hypothetical protein ACWGTO_32495, partial [Mesorhizobium sp. PL10]
DACRLTVELLSLAHERNVEAALAHAIQGDLDSRSPPMGHVRGLSSSERANPTTARQKHARFRID